MSFPPKHGFSLEFYSQKGIKKNPSLLTIGQLVLSQITQMPITAEVI